MNSIKVLDMLLKLSEIILELQTENDQLKEQLKKSINISCDGCKNNSMSECHDDGCIRHVAQFGNDTGVIVKDYYEKEEQK